MKALHRNEQTHETEGDSDLENSQISGVEDAEEEYVSLEEK